MPEASPKKRSNQTGSGKISKRGASVENASIIEEVSTEQTDLGDDKVQPELAVSAPIPEPVKDIMRSEPSLCPVFVDSYEGEYDENGFYHGNGCLRLKDGMVYSGIFKHGKMYNNGILKWPNSTEFSGDFVDNVISGNGTYSWLDGSIYKGEVLNGLRHGIGTFICTDMKTYTGLWENGKRHGKGILYYDESGLSYYNGEWVNNEKCGYGVRWFSNGNIYEGDWKDNKRNGSGTMYWYTNGQEYSGNWVNGIQNGIGEYSWYLKRVSNSQYPLRNKYIGNFLNGERHGHGVFHYASGAMYDGDWEHNKKHGHGKFTFKNGSIFTGQFHNDHMIDFPDLILPRMMTPDITESGIPIRSSSSLRSKSVMEIAKNAVDAILDIDLDEIFYDYKYDLEQKQEEVESIMRTILRHTTNLKNIYKIYSCLGCDMSVDNTFVMTKCQFLRFLKDYEIHRLGFTLAEIARYLEEQVRLNDCFKEIFIRDFLKYLVKISCLLFRNEVEDDPWFISNCFSKLVSHITEEKDPNVKGYMFKSIKHAQEVYKFVDKIYNVYIYFADLYYSSLDVTLKLHDILLIIKYMKLINDDFNCTKLVNILTQEERDEEGYFNLDNEITPFEFLEFLVGSSSVFITDKLIEKYRPSHVIPILSLNSVKDKETVDFIKEEEDASKTNEANYVQSISQEQISPKDSIPDATSISPVKSIKSSGKSNRKNTVNKKVEKETSNTNIPKGKKEVSKAGRKTSSINKMEDAKVKSEIIQDVESVEHEGIQENSFLADKSYDSSAEKVSSVIEEVVAGSDADLGAEMIIDVDIVNTAATEKPNVEPEKQESFEIWSLQLNLFLKEYVFPQYEKRKIVEEMMNTK